MNKVSNGDLYGVLMEIKEDIGGLKSTSGLMLEGLKNHSARIGAVEDSVARQKGATKVWVMLSSGLAAAASAVAAAWWSGK